MQLQNIDIFIIIIYLLTLVGIGLFLSKRASHNLDSYFLGGKRLPWYVLGVSNASGMMDITGTIWLVYLMFVYGLKSIWIPWATWPIFNQVFLMIYLSVWLRRSNVLTGAEWMSLRFGNQHGGELSRLVVVIFAIISVIGFLGYAFKGIGKFSSEFLPWNISDDTYALIFMSITVIYVVAGGMMSVVFTDIVQFIVLTFVSIAVGVIAMKAVDIETLLNMVPEGWADISFGHSLDMDWSTLIPSVQNRIAEDGYSLFSIFFMMMFLKGIFLSMAGPAPNYDMQRVLAARSPKEAAKMSGLVSVVLPFPRYFLVAGVTILAVSFYTPDLIAQGEDVDFERVLPFVISNYMPPGLTGLILVGFLAAFMSTFDSTVNAGSAYVVNDIFKRYIRKDLAAKSYVRVSYVVSILIVAVGMLFGYYIESVDSITQWLFTALFGGYVSANVLKWYWWRLNGYGYFWGMISGILAAIALPLLLPGWNLIYVFPLIFALSALGSVLGSILTAPEDMTVLAAFYEKVRPWGFWGPVRRHVVAKNPQFLVNRDFTKDIMNVSVGLVWQVTLIALPFFIVLQQFENAVIAALVILATSIWLKLKWYNKLED